ncbi:response regulator transcription factor [Nocardia asteroides]|uniref:response regulator transcription factor n=1 Tax=Nocardia asteroides TaxID=1824 RepID=UPI001E43DF91|nr:response regulator transcription factor [Nocardia asteroides]UGT60972.1 response regulator transcription factor [Nocardia asteroides]
MSARLMIVEDDTRGRDALRLAMEDEGYNVAEAGEVGTALDQLRTNGVPDVMIVDLMADETQGFDCIRAIRRDHDVPIIVVGARDGTNDVVAALEAGADDFLAKPFEIREMTARMRALCRRAGYAAERSGARELVLDADPEQPLVLAPAAGAVRRGETELHLTLTEFRLLCELAETPGRVLSRQTLLANVWERGFYGDERIVDVHMRRLRTKIERDPSDPKVVVTVRGLGYRLDLQH